MPNPVFPLTTKEDESGLSSAIIKYCSTFEQICGVEPFIRPDAVVVVGSFLCLTVSCFMILPVFILTAILLNLISGSYVVVDPESSILKPLMYPTGYCSK